jgi:hypothetical protein
MTKLPEKGLPVMWIHEVSSVDLKDHINICDAISNYEMCLDGLSALAGKPDKLLESVYDAGTEVLVAAFKEAERQQFNMIVDENTTTCLVCMGVVFQFTLIAGIIGILTPADLKSEEVRDILDLRFEGITRALMIWKAHVLLLAAEAAEA